MEFDKSRVYTALNANELEVGSTVIVANDLQSLRAKVEKFDTSYEVHLNAILSEASIHRFRTSSGYVYILAYLIEPPKEPKYKPFSDTDTAFKTITAHGGWVKHETGEYRYVSGIDIGDIDGNEIFVGRCWETAERVLKKFVFADDGTPVGEKIEDGDNDAE